MPLSARLITATCALLVLSAGCDSANVLGGVWRSTAPPTGDRVIGSGLPSGETVGVELVLGHYGPDVSGLVRFYRSDEFVLPREPSAPTFACGCSFLHRGRWSAKTQRLDFVLKGCLPGTARQQSVYARGSLTLDVDGLLSGSLVVEDPASALFGRKQEWTFERFDSVARSDLICEPESDADAGNTANGI